jgi:hypothetical protein
MKASKRQKKAADTVARAHEKRGKKASKEEGKPAGVFQRPERSDEEAVGRPVQPDDENLGRPVQLERDPLEQHGGPHPRQVAPWEKRSE